MKTLTIDHKNGNSTTYKLIEDGNDLPIAYHIETPDELVTVLEHLRKNKTRIKLHYGDVKTGKDWNEENDVMGTIGLTRGHKARFPILLNNARSMGGGTILDHCIIKIRHTKGGWDVIWRAKNYKQPQILVVPSDLPQYQAALEIDGEIYSRHKTERAARLLMLKLS